MRETIELRVEEAEAHRLFRPDEGVRLPSGEVRKVTLSLQDERLPRLHALNQELRQQGRALFFGWEIQRRYSEKELRSAELFKLWPETTIPLSGEECGTRYDESTACRRCGAGATQTSDLFLDTRRIPKRADVARTLADEWVVSSRLARAMRERGITGAGFRPVRQAGREEAVSDEWHHLIVAAPPVDIAPPTLTGNDPFDRDEHNAQRCPQGHVAGLNLLSELSVQRASHVGNDLTRTRQSIGLRSGVLRPASPVLISPKLRELLVELEVKRLNIEVVYLV
jgi:hypothetical protein